MILIDNEFQDVETPTGKMRTHIFRPVADGAYPSLILYSEIFQATEPVRRMAAMLAGHGFVVAVPEVYHEFLPLGTVLGYDDAGKEKGNDLKTEKEISAYDSDARALLDFLKQQSYCSGKSGVIGICLGGHLAFRAAMNSDVLATACLYGTDMHTHSLGKGKQDNTLERVSDIKGELLMIFGRQDPHVPPEGRALIHKALSAAESNFTWHEFNAAHAFMRDEGPRYDPALAQLCYALIFELFTRTLSTG